MAKSLAEQVAALPEEEREALLADLDVADLQWDSSFWLRPEQQAPEGDWNIWMILAGRGFGKFFSLGTPILTPKGFVTIGELNPGDYVFSENGDAIEVTHAFDHVMAKNMYRVHFSDGTYLDAGGEHLWTVWDWRARKAFNRNSPEKGLPEDWPTWRSTITKSRAGTRQIPSEKIEEALDMYKTGMSVRKIAEKLECSRQSLAPHIKAGKNIYDYSTYEEETGIGVETFNTDYLYENQTYGNRGDSNFSIPVAKPIDIKEKDLPIDPYVLGLWLGDGASHGSSLYGHKDDLSIILDILLDRGHDLWEVGHSHDNTFTLTIKGLTTKLRLNGLKKNKHIPEVYLSSSITQRKDLLAGLLDTDGFIHEESGFIEFSNTNLNIAEGVVRLARSLGQKPKLSTERAMLYGKDCGPKYRVTWRPTENFFYLPRKAERFIPLGDQQSRNFHRMITKIEKIDPVMVRCISVDSPNRLYLAGEALIPTHNSFAGSEWVRERAKYSNNGILRFGLVARTTADVRDTLVEGPSGILNVHPPSERPEYFPSKKQLVWPNGNVAILYTADEPDQLRGPNFHYAWGDEFAAWKGVPDASGLTAFDNMRIATRLGDNPQLCLTTTPKRTDSLRKILKEAEQSPDQVVITRGKTSDNQANLSKAYLDGIYGIYEGTSLARQELSGEMLDDLEGALWMQNTIDHFRAETMTLGLPMKIVGVDPTVAERPGDECGIVVAACTGERELYRRQAWVLEDATIQGAPDVWAKRVVDTARKWGAPVVVEKNQGGALVRGAINQIDPNIPVFEVWSKQGKALRAEPVALAYEQGRVHHLGFLAELESQMTQWVPGESKSPDRIDALVHALTALMVAPPKGFLGGHLTSRSVANRKLPAARYTGTGKRGATFGAGIMKR